jgi:hypothetical protein
MRILSIHRPIPANGTIQTPTQVQLSSQVKLASLICYVFSTQWETGVRVLITSLNAVQAFSVLLTLTRAVPH